MIATSKNNSKSLQAQAHNSNTSSRPTFPTYCIKVHTFELAAPMQLVTRVTLSCLRILDKAVWNLLKLKIYLSSKHT